jgi:quinol monooxygenase YgiN
MTSGKQSFHKIQPPRKSTSVGCRVRETDEDNSELRKLQVNQVNSGGCCSDVYWFTLLDCEKEIRIQIGLFWSASFEPCVHFYLATASCFSLRALRSMVRVLTLQMKRRSMIYVIATVQVVAGKRDQFLEEFHRLVPSVLAEKGCLFYGPTIDVASGLARQIPLRDSVVTIVESWVSLEDLQAHIVAPHMATYRDRVKDLVSGSELQILSPA